MKERYAITGMRRLANRINLVFLEESSLGDGLGGGYRMLSPAGNRNLRISWSEELSCPTLGSCKSAWKCHLHLPEYHSHLCLVSIQQSELFMAWVSYPQRRIDAKFTRLLIRMVILGFFLGQFSLISSFSTLITFLYFPAPLVISETAYN
ncbi:unnamed protein product, partial [Vitis vinifera]|uniref:Uncharacterized protein n=1 Tax=Vitis vinifera TaxID=29760 RepID=D7T137_VITVI